MAPASKTAQLRTNLYQGSIDAAKRTLLRLTLGA